MKKLFFTSLFVAAFFIAAGTGDAVAQEGQFKLGGGLVLSTGALEFDELDNNFGIRVDGIYRINQDFRAGGDFTFFFPQEEGDVKATVWALNFNGNYIFYEEQEVLAYGLAGLNITSVSVDTPAGDNSESEFGLNLGAGIEYQIDFANLFGEAKFGGIGGDADQFVFAGGLRFPLN